jgi:hypothetical protein
MDAMSGDIHLAMKKAFGKHPKTKNEFPQQHIPSLHTPPHIPSQQHMPLQHAPQQAPSPPDQKRTVIVCVDLGNVHDVLQNMEQFHSETLKTITIAFADCGFQGYGVNPPSSVEVVVSKTGHKNEADTAMIWWIAQFFGKQPYDAPCDVFVASKDQGFRSLETIIHDNHSNARCKFINSWSELSKELMLLSSLQNE